MGLSFNGVQWSGSRRTPPDMAGLICDQTADLFRITKLFAMEACLAESPCRWMHRMVCSVFHYKV